MVGLPGNIPQTEVIRSQEWRNETVERSSSVQQFLLNVRSREASYGVGDIDWSGMDGSYKSDLQLGQFREILVYHEGSEVKRIKITFQNSRTEVFLFGKSLEDYLTATGELGVVTPEQAAVVAPE